MYPLTILSVTCPRAVRWLLDELDVPLEEGLVISVTHSSS